MPEQGKQAKMKKMEKMKKKMAVLLTGLGMSACMLLGDPVQVQAEEAAPATPVAITTAEGASFQVTPTTAYLTMKTDVEVHTAPGTSWTVMGKLRAGQPAIAFGKTDNGWTQIYYIGQIGYIPGDAAQTYAVPEPTAWKETSLTGEIKLNALGDSITFGDRLSNVLFAYPHQLGEQCNAVKVNNYGWNGSCVAGPHPDKLVDRYMTMDRDANLILVLGGTNDYGGYNMAGTPIGKLGDATTDSFYGGLNLLMCGLKQMYPDGNIVFMTPLRRVGYMRRNKNGYCLNQYVTAVLEMGSVYGIRVLDLFHEPELDFSSKKSLYLVDGLHPNELGQALLTAYINRKLFEEP